MKARTLIFIAATIVIVLSTWLAEVRFSNDVLIYLLFPGQVAEILVGGVDSGNVLRERIAPVVGVAVNTSVYALVLLGLQRLVEYIVKPRRGPDGHHRGSAPRPIEGPRDH